jgi:hypothetical protein
MADPLTSQLDAAPPLPQRYKLRGGEGEPTHLVCDEAPRIKVRVRRDFAFSLSEAKELGERVVLLDGAGTFGPLLDNKRRLYNLDHHQECERTFTLATCEQALLMVTSGLDLGEGDWRIFANEPDLDTVLAIWCLLNHVHLKKLRGEARDVLYPLIRLEGAIDANGTALAEVCGLPKAVFDRARQSLDELLQRELAVKGGGDWQTLDLEAYTVTMLGAVDRLIYSVEDFRGYASIEEVYGHVEIGQRSVAVLCRDDSGIYAVEKLLKERWGDQLAVVALEREPGHYTLRRASTLAAIDLNDAYALLNRLDRYVDGRPPGKRWGGSESIGGSPRQGGSALGPSELLRVLGQAFEPINRWQRIRAALQAAGWVAALVGLGVAGRGRSDPAGRQCDRIASHLGAPDVAARLAQARRRAMDAARGVRGAAGRPALADLSGPRDLHARPHCDLHHRRRAARTRDRSLLPGVRTRESAASIEASRPGRARPDHLRGGHLRAALRSRRDHPLRTRHLDRLSTAAAAHRGERARLPRIPRRWTVARPRARALALALARRRGPVHRWDRVGSSRRAAARLRGPSTEHSRRAAGARGSPPRFAQ